MLEWLKKFVKHRGDGLVTLSELSDKTGIKYMTLYMAIRTGRLHAVQSGHVWLSSVEAVNDSIAEGKIRGGER